MKPSYKPQLIALISVYGSFLMAANSAAAITVKEPRIETRTIIINGEEVGDAEQLLAAANAESTETPRVYKDVRVVVAGDSGTHVHAIPPIPPIPPMPNMPDVDVLISNAMSEAFSSSTTGFGVVSRTPVKNAPYSAEVIFEKVQQLPDGNQITRRTSSLAYRDSAGRTRQDVRDDKGEVRTIQIHDSVDGTRFVISPSKKSATKIALDKDIAKRVEEIREKAKAAANSDGTLIIERGAPGGDIVVKRIESRGADGRKSTSEEINVLVTRLSGNPKVETDSAGVLHGHGDRIAVSTQQLPSNFLANSFRDTKWSQKATTTPLGTKDFDGIRADGKRTSYTIPAGEVGNRSPITVTSESWYSPDLQVTVYSKQSDPRTGDSIYRLANVKRIEQPLSLFRVPEDYAIRSTRSIAMPTPPVPPAPPTKPVAPNK